MGKESSLQLFDIQKEVKEVKKNSMSIAHAYIELPPEDVASYLSKMYHLIEVKCMVLIKTKTHFHLLK